MMPSEVESAEEGTSSRRAVLLAMLVAMPAAERPALERALSRFLRSFENLDLSGFMAMFVEDVAVFFPTPEPPERFDGKQAVRAHFSQVFEAIRKGAVSGPPYHHLAPEDLDIRELSPDAALISFHLRNSERIARRSLVFKKVHGDWLIVHLHASNVAAAK